MLSSLSRPCRGIGRGLVLAAWMACAVLPGAARAQAAQGPAPSPAPAASQIGLADYISRAGSPYQACDGYGDPTGSGDGMTSYARVMGIFRGTGDRRRGDAFFGRTGEVGCNLALEDLAKRPQYWMRKVSLLRSRAIHRLMQNNAAGAVADLDAAEAAAVDPDEPFYKRSLGLQVQFARAFVLRRNGDRAGAARLAARVSQARPFSRQTAQAALSAMGDEADFAVRGPVLRRLAQLDPARTGLAYLETFEQGDFAGALEIYPALQPPVKFGDEPMAFRDRVLLTQENRAIAETFWADALGRKAYALAALGRNDEARKALSDAEARLAGATPAPAPLPPKPSDEQLTQNTVFEQTNLKIRTDVPAVLAPWQRMVEARLLLSNGKLAEAAQRFRGDGSLPPTYATIEFLEAISPKLPPGERPNVKSWREDLRKARQEDADADLRLMFKVSPEAETAQRTPGVRRLGGILDWIDGYREEPPSGSPWLKVRYRGVSSTQAMVEEDALLRAAELAAQAGKTALLLHSIEDIEHTTVQTQYGRATAADPTGYESDIEVEFVDAQDYARDHPGVSWRLIDVAAVQTELAGRYRRDGPSTKGSKP